MADDQRTGVFLLNMGGPTTVEEVHPFLLELFSDRDLIALPGGRLVQPLFARLIAALRAPGARRRYAEIGGGSPLVAITGQQAQALQRRLTADGDAFRVTVVMRYTPPRADEAVGAMRAWGATRVVALPLYPHYSQATTGSSLADLEGALARGGLDCPLVRIADYHDHPGYLDAVAATVRRGLERLGPDAAEQATVLFSAHSLPRSLVERGDPYQRQVEACTRGVASRLELRRWMLAYQSRSGPVKWLEPDVLGTIEQLARDGCRALLVVPISFVSDHIETLHEVEIEMRAFAAGRGIPRFERAPALNVGDGFIGALEQIVRSRCQREATT